MRELFIAFCFIPIFSNGQSSYLSPGLQYGKYSVGFKVVEQYDYTRTFISQKDQTEKTKRARPMQTCIWYPASGISNKQKYMLYKDYIALLGSETDFAKVSDPFASPDVISKFTKSDGFSQPQKDEALKMETKAIKNATPLKEKFPVLIYSPGAYGPGFENSLLFEYLCSYGYVVMSCPVNKDQWNIPGTKEKQLQAKIENHTRDIEFMIGYLNVLSNVDFTRIAVAGFSLGGFSSIYCQMKNSNIKAIIPIDGTLDEKSVVGLSQANYDKVNVPVLILTESIQDKPDKVTIPFFDSIRYAPAYNLMFHKFGHLNFGSYWIMLADRTKAIKPGPSVEGTQEEINLGYSYICVYIKNFLDAFLKGNQQASKYLQNQPEENGVPKGFITKTYKDAIKQH